MEPKILDEWTLNSVREVVEKGVLESETLDFKECLPKQKSGKIRLRKICCAFANSEGGFLVFGIADKKSNTELDRLIGINSTLDFPEHFGVYPSFCKPTINWDFKRIPIVLPNNNVVHVVYIPKSWKAPHAIGGQKGGLIFPKRTNKGNEEMSLEEVRMAFLRYGEKRIKLQLLRSEIKKLKTSASEAYIENPSNWKYDLKFADFNTSLLESTIGETYDLIVENEQLISLLDMLRLKAGQIRVKTPLALTWKATHQEIELDMHNGWLIDICKNVMKLCDKANRELDDLYNLKGVNFRVE